MTQTLQNLLVLAAFVILVGLGYYLFTQRDSNVLSLVGAQAEVSPVLLQDTRVFIERRATLEAQKLDTSLFTDPAFISLRSYHTDIPEQEVGRSNIFDDPTKVPEVTPPSIE